LIHERDHERKNITAQIQVYSLPWWRRFFDHLDPRMSSPGAHPAPPPPWRARCRACGWRDDAPDKETAARLGDAHTSEKHAHVDVRDKGIDLYPLSGSRRVLDRFFEVGE
jgi:hypothetical protein